MPLGSNMSQPGGQALFFSVRCVQASPAVFPDDPPDDCMAKQRTGSRPMESTAAGLLPLARHTVLVVLFLPTWMLPTPKLGAVPYLLRPTPGCPSTLRQPCHYGQARMQTKARLVSWPSPIRWFRYSHMYNHSPHPQLRIPPLPSIVLSLLSVVSVVCDARVTGIQLRGRVDNAIDIPPCRLMLGSISLPARSFDIPSSP